MLCPALCSGLSRRPQNVFDLQARKGTVALFFVRSVWSRGRCPEWPLTLHLHVDPHALHCLLVLMMKNATFGNMLPLSSRPGHRRFLLAARIGKNCYIVLRWVFCAIEEVKTMIYYRDQHWLLGLPLILLVSSGHPCLGLLGVS